MHQKIENVDFSVGTLQFRPVRVHDQEAANEEIGLDRQREIGDRHEEEVVIKVPCGEREKTAF